MEDWKERLVNETLELNEKFIKLDKFMDKEDFFFMDGDRQRLLKAQKAAMELYLYVLVERIMLENIPLPIGINLGKKT